MAYFWLLIRSDAAAFSSIFFRAASSLSSSLPGGFELEFASEAATTARRTAGSVPRGHLAVLGLCTAHATGAGCLIPVHCILSLPPTKKPNRIGCPRNKMDEIKFRGNQSAAASRRTSGWPGFALPILPPLKLGSVLVPHFCGSAASQETPSPTNRARGPDGRRKNLEANACKFAAGGSSVGGIRHKSRRS
jgi:hypothetical protein